MAKIVILPVLENKFFDLVFILYDKEYFGFVKTAIAYVDVSTLFMPFQKREKPKNNKSGSYNCS